jgi:hypothetical protein
MSQQVLEIDEQLSWARRVGDAVRIHLRLRSAVLEPGTAFVELLSASGERLRSAAEVTTAEGAIVVTASMPQSELGRSVWQLTIDTPESVEPVHLGARLLAAPTSPVALLPGPAPATRMRPPAPRTRHRQVHRRAARVPASARSVVVRARAWGREVVGRLR